MLILTTATILLGLSIFQRLIESMLARANAEKRIADGAVDLSGDPYLASMALQAGGLFATAAAMNPDRAPELWAILLYAPLLAARVTILVRFRRSWISRLLAGADGGLISPAPTRYRRWIDVVFTVEAAALPLVLGLPLIALGVGAAQVALIVYRNRLETKFETS